MLGCLYAPVHSAFSIISARARYSSANLEAKSKQPNPLIFTRQNYSVQKIKTSLKHQNTHCKPFLRLRKNQWKKTQTANLSFGLLKENHKKTKTNKVPSDFTLQLHNVIFPAVLKSHPFLALLQENFEFMLSWKQNHIKGEGLVDGPFLHCRVFVLMEMTHSVLY